MCVAAFIEGILFAFFTFELLQEQFEAIEINQTYVDDMKEMFGRPLSLLDNMYAAFGYDWYFWLLPTHPCISINYLEKMYTIKEIKKLKEFDEDHFDEDHKLYAKEVRKSTLEKRLFLLTLVLFVLLWFSYLNVLSQKWFKGEL